MQQKYKEKFPKWCNDNDNIYDLALSNDIDSLLSCIFLSQIKGYKINYFYSFDAIARIEETGRKAIGVDIDLAKGKTWGNHVTMLNAKDSYNKQCANLNVVERISRENYFDKFCGSTLLQILSYYDVDISKFCEEAKMILLAIDSTHLGFYSNNKQFNNAHKKYLCDVLQFQELYELEQRHTISDFEDIIEKYLLKEQIFLIKKHLYTFIDTKRLSDVFLMPIQLPQDEFTIIAEYDNKSKPLPKNNYTTNKNDLSSNIFSFAVTNKNFVKYSTIRYREVS